MSAPAPHGSFKRIATFKSPEALRQYLEQSQIQMDLDAEIDPAILGQSCDLDGELVAGNRFCILPMEGWDGTADGRPSELTERRWRRFGESGAKLIWGGEAVAVRHDGRANPNQLWINGDTVGQIARLREILVQAHSERSGGDQGLVIGLQLTHSGRFARPDADKKLKPRILYHHPILDSKFGTDPDYPLLSDAEIEEYIGDFVRAAKLAAEAGFTFVDVKHCHGYLGHEFLSAVERSGRYGGSFENRTRFLRETVEGIRRDVPGMGIAVRFSMFDFVPFQKDADGVGTPVEMQAPYRFGFGADASRPAEVFDLTEAKAFMGLLSELGINLVCTTAGSPYYNPHIQRPAAFPPSDGYLPPEDPLRGVARQINATAELKREFPQMKIIGSGYSYLQEYLPHAAQRQVGSGRVDFVGLGRMVLSYPELPRDVLEGRGLQRKQICRTFSDCTTAPRNGLVSGCYPLDGFYGDRQEAAILKTLKREQ